MAPKRIVESTKGTSKIRFIMLEADVAEGDFADIAHAITNALRPASPATRAIGSARPQLRDDDGSDVPPIEVPPEPEEADEENAGADSAQRPRTSVPRKPYVKKVTVLDVDFKSGDTPFDAFVRQKNPQSTVDKYLTIATWFKRYRQIDTITADHIYTGYKKMGWGTDMNDMSQPFRDLKRAGRGESKKGAFTLNHLGEDVVDKLGS